MLSILFKRFFPDSSVRNLSKQDKRVRKIELTLIRFVPEPVLDISTVNSTGEALSWLDRATDSVCLIEASAWKGSFSLGDFILWCSGDFACARIGEHRSHHARHPDSTFVAPDTVAFKDDDGSLYYPSRDLVLPRQLATDALRAWLVDHEQPPMLHWD